MIQALQMVIFGEICLLLIKEIMILFGISFISVIVEKNQRHIFILSILDQEMLYSKNGQQFNIDSQNQDLHLQ